MRNLIRKNFPTFTEPAFIQEIEANGSLREIKAGTTMMDIGWHITEMPLIYEGKVKVFREDEDGNELFLYYLYPGDACAISLVCSGLEKISKIRAVTLDTTKAIILPISYMDKWMRQYKSWYYFVLETYSFRFEEVLKTVDSIAFQKMDERLADYLARNVRARESRIIQTTHQEIASELNSSREVISRLLKKLEQRGRVRLSRNTIEVIQL